jgi:hypothetical protein
MHQELHSSPMETRECNMFNKLETKNANDDILKQILIDQRVFECGKWKLEAG